VLEARLDDGFKVAVAAPALYETTAATGLPPAVGVRENVDVVIEAAFIPSLKVTTTSAPIATPVAAVAGETFITVGDVTSGAAAVVNEELKGVRGLPDVSVAPLVTFTV
jgi:hypothetical protein